MSPEERRRKLEEIAARVVDRLDREWPAQDAHIKLIGTCEAPSRWIGLTELRKATTPFTDVFYYDISVVGGRVERIQQFVTVSGC